MRGMYVTGALLVGLALCGGVWSAGAAPVDPPMGVYRGANETAKVEAFAAWVGWPAVWGEDTIGWESWSNVAWPVWWLDAWSKYVHAGPGRRLILTVPLLTGPVDGSGPTQGDVGVGVPVSLEKGAAGAYNAYYEQLAKNLVAYKLADSVVRLGWEFNGNWYPWRAKDKAQAFADYFAQVVKTMRAVPGTEQLKFCWNPTLGYEQFAAETAWPGDAVVDCVGVDVYDESWQPDTYPWPENASLTEIESRQAKVWTTKIYGGDHGLAFWTKFAHDHGKPLAICEWAVKRWPSGHGGQDDPQFVEQMHRFITDPANNVFFHCYFDYNCQPPDGHHQISAGGLVPGQFEFPRSAAKFLELFGGRTMEGARP